MPFKPGEGGGRAGRKSPQPGQFLREIRWVYEHPEPVPGEKGSPEGLKLLRELRERDPERFLARRERLEREFRQSKEQPDQGAAAPGGTDGAPSSPADERTDDLIALVDRLLADHGVRPEGGQ